METFDHVGMFEQIIKDYHSTIARKGGNARAKSLTPKRRQQIARKAAKARWSKKNP